METEGRALAVSFTPKEKKGIIEALRKAAVQNAAAVGMRRTTVDQLAEKAGISKGAFYKFYPSKEHLFLDMLEQWYSQLYQSAELTLAQNQGLPPRQRAALALKAAWRVMLRQPLMRFCRDEIPLMVRKLPEALLKEHYQSVDDFIRTMIERSHVTLRVTQQEACAAVKILFFSLLTAQEVGDDFKQAMDGLVDGACLQMVEDS